MLVVEFPRKGRRVHDYSDLPYPHVVHGLAEAHLALLNTGGPIKSPDTSSVYATALASFVRWLQERGFNGMLADLSGDLFHAFLLSESVATGRYMRHIKILIRTYEGIHPGSVDPDVVHYAQSPELLVKEPDSKPIQPFSESEARRIEETCKAAIVQLEKRLNLGEELLTTGADPAVHGVTPENLLWLFAHHGPIPQSRMGQICGMDRNTIRKHLNRISGPNGLPIRALANLLYPTRTDMAPFMVLFGLQTGLSPESIPRLARADVNRLGESKVRIRYRKQRSRGKHADNFSIKGLWSPGRLIKRALLVTKRARAFVNAQDRDCIWIYMHYQGQNQKTKNTLVVAPDLYGSRRLGEFIAQAGILDDQGKPLDVDLRRLRKTWYARQDKKWHGAVKMIAGVNQTQRVAADHYLDIGIETPAIDNAITGTQYGLVRRAEQARALVLTEADLREVERNPEKAMDIAGLTPDQSRVVLSTEEEDVYIAKCKGFHDSPFGQPGQPCPAAVWECLFCVNAIITPSKLPNIVALLHVVDARFYEMSREEWRRRFAAVFRAITKNIKPKFSPTVWAAAEAVASSSGLYIRPEDTIS